MIRLHLSARAIRAWLNEPSRHDAPPSAGGLYSLLLRPVERPDLHRNGR